MSFFILLQGSYHQFVWALFFIGLLALSMRRRFWLLAVTAVFAVLIAMVRILPATLLVGRIGNEFTAGYLLLQSIWQSLTQIQIPNDLTNNMGLTTPIGTWEYTFFIGLPAGLFILYFGVVRTFLEDEDPFHLLALVLPCLGLIMLSLDDVFKTLRQLMPIPLFTGERVSARIFSLAFAFILIAASIQFQRWLDKKRLSAASTLAIALAVGLGANDLVNNLSLWSINNAAKYFPPLSFDSKLYYPVNQYNDTQYLVLLVVGLAITLVSAAVLLYLAWREQRMARKA